MSKTVLAKPWEISLIHMIGFVSATISYLPFHASIFKNHTLICAENSSFSSFNSWSAVFCIQYIFFLLFVTKSKCIVCCFDHCTSYLVYCECWTFSWKSVIITYIGILRFWFLPGECYHWIPRIELHEVHVGPGEKIQRHNI